ncbi:glycosyltransferase 87 family protein [Dactylosporangium darangshiense]|uniref:Glycosyltransferase 87 family protein n=1 Tax=Dactylosporangium darangshiense TaxID=579108 RepID=A0ABP8DH83_9ACTN
MLRRSEGAGLFLLAVMVAGFVAVSARWQGQFDLQVYHDAVRSWLRGGDLYAYRHPGTVRAFGFTYPPFAAVVLVPLALLPWQLAAVVLAGVSVAGTVALLWLRFGRIVPVVAATVLLAAAEPWRDTLSLGQINLVLLTLAALDLLVLLDRSPLAGVLIGLAAGIKLAPVLFVGYLLLSRRYRAAGVASATALLTVAVGWAVAPGASRRYWTELVWGTDRIGDVASLSNQSLLGAVHRLGAPGWAWPVLVVAVLAGWAAAVRVFDCAIAAVGHRPHAVRDEAGRWAGLAVTGVAICLLSPVSWLHHLVWQLPAVLVLTTPAATGRARVWCRVVAAGVFTLMATRVVWLFDDPGALAYPIGANLHVLTGLLLLAVVPMAMRKPVAPG